ncbi:MAG: translation elongation factor Ts [Hyphomicrobiaceae bacterium]
MTTITAALVKELREKTGAGMMDCKTALTETKGAMEEAVDWLRKKGLSKAGKKADRIAADGLIGVVAAGTKGALVEVNSETDFVARNDTFQDLVRQITSLAGKANGELAKLLAMPFPGKTISVDEHVKEMIATIGENMSVRRTAALEVKEGLVASYIHNRAADGVGKIGVLVALDSKGKADKLADIGRQLALHIAAANPQAVSADELDKDLIERERQVYLEQAKATGKAEEFIGKMVDGRLRKEFFGQVVLLQQTFMGPGGDGKITVEQYLKAEEKAAGSPVKVTKFVRFALGEGIDKKKDDFAAEVAKLTQGS